MNTQTKRTVEMQTWVHTSEPIREEILEQYDGPLLGVALMPVDGPNDVILELRVDQRVAFIDDHDRLIVRINAEDLQTMNEMLAPAQDPQAGGPALSFADTVALHPAAVQRVISELQAEMPEIDWTARLAEMLAQDGGKETP